MERIHYSACPLCSSQQISFILKAKDHTVSREVFEIWECANCSGRFTQDIPTENEVSKYYQSDAYISHSDSTQGIVNKIYHQVRKITLKKKKDLVQKVTSLKKGSVLDIGAGTGLFVKTMQDAGWEVTGLEPDSRARKIALGMNIELREPSNLFSFPPETFDAITLWHVLEHVHSLHAYLDQLQKLLKVNGTLIIAVPNYTSDDAQHYGASWAAYDVPRHLYHFSPRSMDMLLTRHRFAIKQTFPQWFDSFYVSLLSVRYKTGKTSLVKGGWEGLISNWKALKDKSKCSSVIYVTKKQG